MDRRLFLAIPLLVAATTVVAGAQTTPAAPPATPPLHVRGKIAALAGNALTVNGRDGKKLEITLKDPVAVSTVKKLALADITPNTYVGTATRAGKDGKLTALEVLVFPEAMRGVAEGFQPWDLEPGSMMTNGTVMGVMKSASGRQLTIGYKDKNDPTKQASNTVYVPPKAPIVTFAPATHDDLKPGAPVFLSATKGADGKWTAARATVGTHGVAPPM